MEQKKRTGLLVQDAVLGLMAFSVFAGEVISCYVFGPVIVTVINRIRRKVRL